MALAMEWVARITAVGIEMVVPGIAGQWLDQRIGTSFIGLVGFAVGVVGGMWHLLLMTQAADRRRERSMAREQDSHGGDGDQGLKDGDPTGQNRDRDMSP
jgi:hypothetical protein